jgi:hypothetical protein
VWPPDAAADAPHEAIRIAISELMYEPRRAEPRARFDGANHGPYVEEADDDSLQYVELHNPHAVAVELTGWSLGGGVTFGFPPATRLDPGAYLVVAADPDRLASLAGVTGALGPWPLGRPPPPRRRDRQRARRDRRHRGPRHLRRAAAVADAPRHRRRRPRADRARRPPRHGRKRARQHRPAARAAGRHRHARPREFGRRRHRSAVRRRARARARGPRARPAVTITARITADAPLTSTELLTTTGLDPAVTTAPMLDDGLHGDGAAGDGVYAAIIPGAAARTLVHYRVRAATAADTTTYPYDDDPAPTRAYYHRPPSGSRYHLFLAQPELDVLQAAARATPRRDVDARGTLVIDGVAFPDIRVGLGGRWPRANPPFAWRFRLHPDRPHRGVTALNLTWSRPDVQQAIFDAFATVGLPHLASEVIDLDLTTGATTASPWARYLVFESPDARWLATHAYPDATALYQARSCESSGPRRNSDLYYFGDPGDERAGNGLQTDFNLWGAYNSVHPFAPPDDVRALVAALGDLPDAELHAWLDANLDVDGWFRSIALHVYLRLSDFSTHNYFLLRPPGGTWQVLSYDFDQFGNFWLLPAHYAARQDPREDPSWQRNRLHERIALSPTLRRIYLLTMRALLDAHPPASLLPPAMCPPIDEQRAALLAELAAAALPPRTAAPAITPCDDPARTVTLTVPAGWDIYYTLDATDPRLSPTRLRYTAPLTLTAATTLRAAALASATPPSAGAWTDRTDCTFTAP